MVRKSGAYHHGDLQAALLAEAAVMIADGGASSVTMRALSERLGVSRTAAYRHFPDKSALLEAVAAAGFRRLEARLQTVGAGASRPSVEHFRRMGEEYVRFALENPAHYRLMYGKEAITRQDRPKLREAGDALLAQLVDLFKAHQRAGTIKRQNPQVQAYVAWSAVHGLASLVLEGQIQAVDEIDALIRQTTRTLLDGMRASSRRGST